MANTLISIGPYSITDTFSTAYTVPSVTIFTLALIHLINTTSSSITVSICLGGDTVADAMLWDFELGAHDFIEFGRGDLWEADITLRVKAAIAGITLKAAGIETT